MWISALVTQEHDAVYSLMAERYGAYLESLEGEAFRKKVFDYIHHEDSPRPVTWQLDRLRKAGFDGIELLHKNSLFAAFGAWRSA